MKKATKSKSRTATKTKPRVTTKRSLAALDARRNKGIAGISDVKRAARGLVKASKEYAYNKTVGRAKKEVSTARKRVKSAVGRTVSAARKASIGRLQAINARARQVWNKKTMDWTDAIVKATKELKKEGKI